MKPFGLVNRLLTSVARATDGSFLALRTNQYAELAPIPDGLQRFALEGSYFVTTTPTFGTGVAMGIAACTSLVATSPSLFIRNTAALGNQDMIMKRLSLICTAAGTAGAALECAIYVDTTNRYTSGGSTWTPANIKVDSSTTTIASVYNSGGSSIVASAASGTTRLQSRSKLRTGIPVIGDVYSLNFGTDPTFGVGALSGSASGQFSLALPPLVIPPQACALVYFWSASQTAAPAFEVVMEHVER